ncbi:MAG: CPBP family intramembrane metalloprotease [Bacteroidetes bacterium]|nr:CPBP family intramembrane metalloprotease [Bacteroidota bacterium]
MIIEGERPIHYVARIFICVGIFILTVFFADFFARKLVWLFFHLDTQILQVKPADEFSRSEAIAIKVHQTFIALGILFSAVLTALVAGLQLKPFARLNVPVKAIQIPFLILAFAASVPVVGYLLTWNQSWNLPKDLADEFQKFEEMSNNLYSAFLKLNDGGFLFFNLFFMALLPAIGEELVFRGLLLNFFRGFFNSFQARFDTSQEVIPDDTVPVEVKPRNSVFSLHLAVLMSAVMFTLIHAQPYKLFPMMTLALVLGYLYVYSGSLWISIIFHFLNNSVFVLLTWAENHGLEVDWLQEDFQFTGGTTLVAFFVLIITIWFIRKISKPIGDY